MAKLRLLSCSVFAYRQFKQRSPAKARPCGQRWITTHWHTDSWAIQSPQPPAEMSCERLVPLAQSASTAATTGPPSLESCCSPSTMRHAQVSFPHSLPSKDTSFMTQPETLINGMDPGRLTTHTLPLVCYLLNTTAEQGRGVCSASSRHAGDLHSPIPLTNSQSERQEMMHDRNILTKTSPSRNEKSSLYLRSSEEEYFLRCLI